VQEAAANILAEVCARFESADKLSDEDRNAIIEIARQALTPFLPKPEANAEVEATPKPEATTGLKPASKGKPKPESKRALESNAKTEPDSWSKPDAPTVLTAEAKDKS
jgi:F-type H+-transporting ATPase subunit alpha